MGKYDDIINMKWPVPSKRPRMDMESRAKIFLPFSALKGLGNAIDEQNKTKDNMREYEYFDEENKVVASTLSINGRIFCCICRERVSSNP